MSGMTPEPPSRRPPRRSSTTADASPAKKSQAGKTPAKKVAAKRVPVKKAAPEKVSPRRPPAKKGGEQKVAQNRPPTESVPAAEDEPKLSFPRPQVPRTRAVPRANKIAAPRFSAPPAAPNILEFPVAAAPAEQQERAVAPVRKPRSRVSSAGYALAVGLICFGLWTVLDARQLFNSANASPLGTRRSVSMSILRPIASFEEFFGLDRLVDGGNRALGRTPVGTPGGGTTPPPVTTTPPPSTTIGTTPGQGTTTPPPPPSGPLTLAQPTTAHPISILQVGDSIGEDLGYGLAATIGNDPRSRFVQASVGDTGLSNIAYYNWPAKLAQQLRQYHPRLVIVMLGANDWQAFLLNNNPVQPGTAPWIRAYTERVGEMMAEATSSGARVLWVGLPVMQSPSFSHDVATLNTIYRTQARLHPGTAFVPTWKLFSTKSGKYSEYLDVDGSLAEVRVADGVHISPPGGTSLLGSYVVERIDSIWHIHL